MDLFRFIDVHLVAQRLDFTSSFFGCWVGKTGMAQVEHLKIAWRLVTITATTVEDEEVGEVCLSAQAGSRSVQGIQEMSVQGDLREEVRTSMIDTRGSSSSAELQSNVLPKKHQRYAYGCKRKLGTLCQRHIYPLLNWHPTSNGTHRIATITSSQSETQQP